MNMEHTMLPENNCLMLKEGLCKLSLKNGSDSDMQLIEQLQAELAEVKAQRDTAKQEYNGLGLQLEQLQADIRNLKSGHFCPSPQLAALGDVCNCAHSDRHRAMDWSTIKELQAERDKLKRNLLIYGLHLDDCPCYIPLGKWSDNTHHTLTDDKLNLEETNAGGTIITVKCTCGFEKAQKGMNMDAMLKSDAVIQNLKMDIKQLQAELKEQKRECKEGWRRWKVLKDG